MPPSQTDISRKPPFYRRYWQLLLITGLLVIYLLGFPSLSVSDLYQTEIANFEVVRDDRGQGITLFKEGAGPDIVLRVENAAYHLPAQLWADRFSADSLMTLLRRAERIVLFLGDAGSTNIFGLHAENMQIDPRIGVADYNEKRRWVLYLIIALYGAVLLDWITRRIRR